MYFLGVLFPREDEAAIRAKSKKGVVQNQANTFQWNCIDGLYENLGSGIQIINALPVGTFPMHYRELFLRSKSWVYHGERHCQVGGINLPFLKQYSRYKKIRKLLQKSGEKEILIYSAYLPFLKAVQKLSPDRHVKLIVPDLPEFYDYSKDTSRLKTFFRKRNNKKIYDCLKRVDSFVLLTEAMKEPLGVGTRPYVVVEGICGYTESRPNETVNESKKVILYTGTLNRKFGIDVLVDAFLEIKDEACELWICGAGDYEGEIKAAAVKDSRIKFFGFVTKEEAERKQREAAVLVNPRQNIGEYTKYSFPSKTMEYLLSGKPLVAYKLDGIPDEYDAYINYVGDNSKETLSTVLVDVLENYDLYRRRAESAQEFISGKGPAAQMKKVLGLK